MKTEQILVRRVGDAAIRQNHKTKMFCITDILSLYPDKRPAEWARLNATKEFIKVIMDNENLTLQEVVQTNRGNSEKRGTWVHPLLMVDYAMWVSPEFKYVVLKWVHDNLCEFRDDVGERFKEMNAAVHKVLAHGEKAPPILYIKEATMVASVVGLQLGKRNEHTEEELKKLDTVQKLNAHLILKGVTDRAERRAKLVEALEMFASLKKPTSLTPRTT